MDVPHETPAERSQRLPAGDPVPLTCPECHGPLWESDTGHPVRYRCRVGHAYNQDVLLDAKGTAVEAALWMAVEALEERSDLLLKVAGRMDGEGRGETSAALRARAQGVAERAELIRGVLAIHDEPAGAVEADAA